VLSGGAQGFGRAAPEPDGARGLGRAAASREIRALWVVRTTLTSREAIAKMVASARASGFNTLLVQVRGRGDAYYQGSIEPRAPALAGRDALDPLAETIALAHEAGLEVHAWINVNLVAGLDLPTSREHVIYRHPEWLMVPAALAADLAAVNVRGPEYLGRLARYARSRSGEVEGLYLTPVVNAAAEYSTKIVRDIAERYDVDGIHLDYIRYPEEDFDYGVQTLSAFRQTVVPELDNETRRSYDARLTHEPAIYARGFPERWRTFRSDRLTALVARIRVAVRAARPTAIVSAAVAPDPGEAATRRLQDWRRWLDRGLLDVVCPMAYTPDGDVFEAQIAEARLAAGSVPVWAGIGAYRLTPAQIGHNVQTSRRLGVDGVILFSYDSLTEPPRGPGYLAQVARAAFTSH
jgi:uncharacterized lipoprotein YddW (UPF0748 family)